ncbi:MAG: hypothetical protein KIH10_16960, partial [Candidatus Freyarchaeota archaeon]|nr:hypothetical protein [Candidatus Jordarchaeia archaeon]
SGFIPFIRVVLLHHFFPQPHKKRYKKQDQPEKTQFIRIYSQGGICGLQGDSEGAHCTNPNCRLHKAPVKPEGLAFLYLPHMTYGASMVFFVGEKRLNDWLYRQIREALHVKPALSSISRFLTLLEELALALPRSSGGNQKHHQEAGGYILMADATEHREANPHTMWWTR